MPDYREVVRERLSESRLPETVLAEIVEEVAAHLADVHADALEAGASEETARRTALLELESDPPLHEALPRRPARAASTEPWKRGGFGIGFPSIIEHAASLLQDLRYGLRGLRHRPLFTVAALLTLALGIGANSALFSLVYGVLLRPLPWAESEQLVVIWRSAPENPSSRGPLTDDEFDRLAGLEVITGAAAHEQREIRLVVNDTTTRLAGASVSAGFGQLLGLQAQHGRWLADSPEAPEIVLARNTAAELFGQPSDAIGRSVVVDERPHTIVGVLADGDSFPAQSAAWLLRPALSATARSIGFASLTVIGRVQAGTDLGTVRATLDTVAAADTPEAYGRGTRYATASLQETIVGEVRPVLVRFALGVGLVLLIACANVANLLLEQAAARRGERAVRRSLGASRLRLVRQSLVESLLLGGMGAALGVGLAWAGVRTFVALDPLRMPRLEAIQIDAAVLVFTLALGLLTGLLFGIAPALRAGRESVRAVLGESAAGTPSAWRGRGLAVLELSMSMTLLIGAALLVHSFLRMAMIDPGYDADRVLTARLDLGGMGDAEVTNAAVADMIDRLTGLPGIAAVSFAEVAPPAAPVLEREVMIEGRPLGAGDARPRAWAIKVGAAYFDALGLEFLDGASFTAEDVEAERRQVVVNSVFARRYLEGDSGVGRRLLLDGGLWEIVGVVADARLGDVREEAMPTVYQPGQRPVSNMTVGGRRASFSIGSWLVIRASGDVRQTAAQVSEIARAVPGSVTVARLDLVADQVWSNLAAPRVLAGTFGAFALSGALLAAIGVYAVTAYSVSRRTYELGVRMVMGATPRGIVRGVMLDGVVTIAGGVALGTVAALALSRYIGNFLYDIESTDVLTYAFVAALLALIAAVATYVPARHAVSIDPIEALRRSPR